MLWGVFWGLLSSLGVVFGASGRLLGAISTLFREILNSTTGFSELRSVFKLLILPLLTLLFLRYLLLLLTLLAYV